MSRRVNQRLHDILAACDFIIRHTDGLTLDDYLQNEVIRAAVERKLGIIAEALRQAEELDPDISERIPDIRRIVGIRNHLIHGYNAVDDDSVWSILQRRLPSLRRQAITMLEEDSAYGGITTSHRRPHGRDGQLTLASTLARSATLGQSTRLHADRLPTQRRGRPVQYRIPQNIRHALNLGEAPNASARSRRCHSALDVAGQRGRNSCPDTGSQPGVGSVCGRRWRGCSRPRPGVCLTAGAAGLQRSWR